MTYRKGTRQATDSAIVLVKQGQPPEIFIEPVEGQHDPDSPLIIRAWVSSPLAFEAVWSSVSGEGRLQACQVTVSLIDTVVFS